mmetsp:Transcript_35638/g.100352  ORF Transcript_35638/g.100352 Transcript_35638/m.100352 type:complete len:370 (-) Transcript_35638:805-1914(-)
MFRHIVNAVIGTALAYLFFNHQSLFSIRYAVPQFDQGHTPSVIVTGASRGIGQAAAYTLVSRGFRVYAGVRNEGDGERIREDLKYVAGFEPAMRELLRPVMLDMSHTQHLGSLVEMVAANNEQYPLHGVVHNAASISTGPMEFIPDGDIRYDYEVNLIGPTLLTKRVLPLLVENHGRIVFVSSLGSEAPPGFLGVYEASKLGLGGLATSLRHELAHLPLFVGVVKPGMVKTKLWHQAHSASMRSEIPNGWDTYQEYYSPERIEYREKYLYSIMHSVSETNWAILDSLVNPFPQADYLLGFHGMLLTVTRTLPAWFMDRMMHTFYWPGPQDWGVEHWNTLVYFILLAVVLAHIFWRYVQHVSDLIFVALS